MLDVFVAASMGPSYRIELPDLNAKLGTASAASAAQASAPGPVKTKVGASPFSTPHHVCHTMSARAVLSVAVREQAYCLSNILLAPTSAACERLGSSAKCWHRRLRHC